MFSRKPNSVFNFWFLEKSARISITFYLIILFDGFEYKIWILLRTKSEKSFTCSKHLKSLIGWIYFSCILICFIGLKSKHNALCSSFHHSTHISHIVSLNGKKGTIQKMYSDLTCIGKSVGVQTTFLLFYN